MPRTATRERSAPRQLRPRRPVPADALPAMAASAATLGIAQLRRADVQPVRAHVAPARPAEPARGSVRACIGDLRGALAEGWEIVQPIFARPLWSVADDSATAFNFVLRRDRATRLVIVPEGRTVARFIRDRHLHVDYGCS